MAFYYTSVNKPEEATIEFLSKKPVRFFYYDIINMISDVMEDGRWEKSRKLRWWVKVKVTYEEDENGKKVRKLDQIEFLNGTIIATAGVYINFKNGLCHNLEDGKPAIQIRHYLTGDEDILQWRIDGLKVSPPRK